MQAVEPEPEAIACCYGCESYFTGKMVVEWSLGFSTHNQTIMSPCLCKLIDKFMTLAVSYKFIFGWRMRRVLKSLHVQFNS